MSGNAFTPNPDSAGPSRVTSPSPAQMGAGSTALGDKSDHNDTVRGIPRTRKFHHRSKMGCEHCKKRRVRCDERKPVCGNCVKKGTRDKCVFPKPTKNDAVYEIINKTQTPAAMPASTIPPQGSAWPQAFLSNWSGAPQVGSTAYLQPADIALDQDSFSFPGPSGHIAPQTDDITQAFPDMSSVFDIPSNDPFASLDHSVHDDSVDVLQLQRPAHDLLADPPPLSPNTTNMLNLFFASPKTPPLPHFTWSDEPSTHAQSRSDQSESSKAQADWPNWGFGLGFTSMPDEMHQTSSSWNNFRHAFISEAILRQTHILQQPNELAAYFPTTEERRQFSHFLNETSSDLLVVSTPQSTNPWILHLSHLALGKAFGHEILHDAFRYGLLSLASFDMGLKMRRQSHTARYQDLYQSSIQQRRLALQLLDVAKVLKLYQDEVDGADLVLATVAALAIRDRLAGTADFEEPLNIGVATIMDQGGAVAYIARHPTPGCRFLVEQMAILELLGSMTTWESPRILRGDMTWFTYGNPLTNEDHLIEVYGWDRMTIAHCAESMALADEIKQVWQLRSAYRRTSYPALQSALAERVAVLDQRHKVMTRRSASLRLETTIAPLHPRAAIGGAILQACMDLLLTADTEDEDTHKALLYPKCRAVLDLCEISVERGMYAGLLLPLTWAAYCLNPTDQIRLRKLFHALQPHYHVDPDVMETVINVDWTVLIEADPSDWCLVMKKHGFYMTIF